jgi:hypothetical protein
MKRTSLAAAWIAYLLLSLGAQGQTLPQAPPQTGASASSVGVTLNLVILPSPVPEPGPCPDWQPGTAYQVGDCVFFANDNFRCIQAHTSQIGWEPPNAPALWQLLPTGLDIWKPQISYAVGDFAIFQDAGFNARQAHTSQIGWEPPNAPALWLPAARIFAPYLDVSDPNRDAIVSGVAQQGVKFLTFASITAQQGCFASWLGTAPISANDSINFLINRVRAGHGDVILSFGGVSGTDLALACPDAGRLQGQYQRAISAYSATMLDFEVAEAVLTNVAARERLNAAVAGLQAVNPGLIISYTLPVLSTGLTPDSSSLLSNAKAHGVQLRVINLQTRDFESAAQGNAMIDNVGSAASGAIADVKRAGFAAQIGITPMIGRNNLANQAFTQADAQSLLQAALGSVFVGRLSMWSINRDHQCLGTSSISICSGVQQQPFDFSRIFVSFH